MADTNMPETNPERRHSQEIFLQLAAYRALHHGGLPPLNSELWRECERLKAEGTYVGEPRRKPFRLFPWWRKQSMRHERRLRPLETFKIEMPFLTDDYSPESVEARLAAWPMVSAFGMIDRHPTGEWFVYGIEVKAEDARESLHIMECIFALPCLREEAPEGF